MINLLFMKLYYLEKKQQQKGSLPTAIYTLNLFFFTMKPCASLILLILFWHDLI